MSYDKQPGTGSVRLDCAEEAWAVKVYTDGTTTEAEVYLSEEPEQIIGWGAARRRKGDKRKDSVGTALAVARAFEHAAGALRAVADDVLEGRVAP